MIISYQLIQSFLATPIEGGVTDLGDRLTQHGIEVERYLPVPDREKLSLGTVKHVIEGRSTLVLANSSHEIIVPLRLEVDFRYVVDCFDGENRWQLTTPVRLGWSSLTTALWVPNGLSIETAWELDDQLVEISITPNRGDCLSYLGLCRDLSLSQRVTFSKETLVQQFKDRYKVVWDGQTQMEAQVDLRLSPLYCVAKIYCPTRLNSPFWLQRFLIKHGLSSIMPSVDVSQYLMLIFGHPTHAFDAMSLQKSLEITVKDFSEPQELTLLDGKTISLSGACPVIIGGEGNVVALPGLMGSKDSSARNDSKDLMIEAAFFDPSAIRSLRKFGLVTDASLRFERGVDSQGQADLLEIFCGMMQSIHPQVLCWSPVSIKKTRAAPLVLKTTFEKLQSLAGVPLSPEEVTDILVAMGGESDKGVLSLAVPSWRFDLTMEQNFLAEILRVYGINRITLPSANRDIERTVICTDPAVSSWIEKGFNEVVTYSFVSKAWASIDTKEEDLIELQNPLNQDFAIMRPSAWPSLLDILADNKRCGGKGMGVVEKSPLYHKSYPFFQKRVVSAALYAERNNVHWDSTQKSAEHWTYYDVKGLIGQLGLTCSVKWEPLVEENAFLHPTISAQLISGEQCVGWVGLIHPALAQAQNWPQAFLIQIDEKCWDKAPAPTYKAFSRFPKVQRDFSFICPDGVKAQDVLDTFRSKASYLVSLDIFDYYMQSGSQPTLGVSAVVQAPDKTLDEHDIVPMIQSAITELRDTLGVTLKNE